MRFLISALLLGGLAACSPSGSDGPVQVAIIGDPAEVTASGVRLSPAGQHLRAATAEGLVALDEAGLVVPALAERWIVTDDGQSYIFRLRNSEWSDGETVSAMQVRNSLRSLVRQLQGTSLGLDLEQIDEIRAMTGRVIEIRLKGPMPDFLRLLAQPEMGIMRGNLGEGPMRIVSERAEGVVMLEALPPERRGLPAREDWRDFVRPLMVRSLPAQQAVEAFSSGEVDLVLNGGIASIPLADTGPLTRGTIRLDGVNGLFGLVFRNENGLLSDPQRREALSMAIDRAGLMQPLNIGGWQSSTWIVPLGGLGDAGPQQQRWEDLSLQDRRDIARQRVTAWERAQGRDAVVRIAMPKGPGADTLFAQISGDLGLIGVTARQVGLGDAADLELYDRLARYGYPLWYLNQFNCRLKLGLCSPEADELVERANRQQGATEKLQLLAQAHRELVSAEVFIPLGAPVRWSLVRGNVFGFENNEWGLHPLFPLVQSPN